MCVCVQQTSAIAHRMPKFQSGIFSQEIEYCTAIYLDTANNSTSKYIAKYLVKNCNVERKHSSELAEKKLSDGAPLCRNISRILHTDHGCAVWIVVTLFKYP